MDYTDSIRSVSRPLLGITR